MTPVPNTLHDDSIHLRRALQATLRQCAQACAECAAGCIQEGYRECAQHDLLCQQACQYGASLLSFNGNDEALEQKVIEAVAVQALTCAQACEKHGDSEHCTFCAARCREVERVAQQFLSDRARQAQESESTTPINA